MNEDQTPQEIVAEVKEIVKTVWTTGREPLTETDVRKAIGVDYGVETDVREIRTFQSSANFGKAGDADLIRKMKEELRLKMAARYGNRHDRRQAVAMGRKAKTKARHLAWKKALQKGTPVAATPFPAGAHQPSSKALKRELRKLGQETGIDFELGTVGR